MPHKDEQPPAHHPTHRVRFGTRLRTYFLTGLVIAAPLLITAYLTWWLVDFFDRWVKPLIPARYNPDYYLPFAVPGFGLIVALVSITMLGAFTANLVGRTLVSWGETILDRMPFIRSVYRALKQIFETVFSREGNSFQQVGLIEYPRKEVWSIVFVATSSSGEINAKVGGEDTMIAVFMPSTPNPTTGFLMYVPRSQLVLLEMSLEEAAKLIISGGLVEPAYPRAAQENGRKRVPPVQPAVETRQAAE